jgi:CheY-like chemotaxis protein
VPRDDDASSPARWSELPSDPQREGIDVTGALHDVSNALTVLLGWAAEARSGGLPPSSLERALAIIEAKAREARDVARRAIGAHVTLESRDANVDEVVSDVVETLSVEADRAHVKVTQASHAPGVRVPDALGASRVLTNLLLNAVAWTPRGGRVTVEVHAGAREVSVTVADEGPGVEAQNAARIFDGGRSTRKGGAGIGLRHARALARAVGGDLELVQQGTTHGAGARFRMRWPRLAPSSLGPATPTSAIVPGVLAGRRVLVVEDDGDVAMLLESALEARGARVVVARSAEELERVAADRHDAALVDLSPIARDVPGALDALKRGSPGLALVFISGSAAGLPEALDVGGVRWVRKPFEVAEIVAALTEG